MSTDIASGGMTGFEERMVSMKMNKLGINDLEHVSGGQYDPDVAYTETSVIRNGYIYNVANIRETVGQISAGQKVGIHPDFAYVINGVDLCMIRIGTQDYVTERANIA